jgi:uncharacterized protein YbaR (Trm112 family)
MALDQLLVEILVDPEDKLPLWYFDGEEILYNPRLHRRYDIRDGIPVLLISESTTVDDAAAKVLADRSAEARVTGGGGA